MCPTDDDVDAAVLALARDYGRKGINEAVVWTVLLSRLPQVQAVQVSRSVQRLVDVGTLYRHYRRTRTMLHAMRGRRESGESPDDPTLF